MTGRYKVYSKLIPAPHGDMERRYSSMHEGTTTTGEILDQLGQRPQDGSIAIVSSDQAGLDAALDLVAQLQRKRR